MNWDAIGAVGEILGALNHQLCKPLQHDHTEIAR